MLFFFLEKLYKNTNSNKNLKEMKQRERNSVKRTENKTTTKSHCSNVCSKYNSNNIEFACLSHLPARPLQASLIIIVFVRKYTFIFNGLRYCVYFMYFRNNFFFRFCCSSFFIILFHFNFLSVIVCTLVFHFRVVFFSSSSSSRMLCCVPSWSKCLLLYITYLFYKFHLERSIISKPTVNCVQFFCLVSVCFYFFLFIFIFASVILWIWCYFEKTTFMEIEFHLRT